MVLGPLTGNPELDKNLAEEHERRLLEEVEADRIAKGDPKVKEGEYQPVTEDENELIKTPHRNRRIKHD